ncbi:MAG: heavy-metal-associated domain-containing protein [Firmicutes bacterium]|nr:heavy-metal-associated domain-containing protein [Bacillota bacterium]
MANLEQGFKIVGNLSEADREAVKKSVSALEGVNAVKFDPAAKKVLVGYTPGTVNIQNIKEAIESRGVDVSDRGDD